MTKPRVKEIEVTITRKLTLEGKTCLVCGKTFWGVGIKRYCKRACQNRARYDRHAEQYRKARMAAYYEQKKTELLYFSNMYPQVQYYESHPLRLRWLCGRNGCTTSPLQTISI